MRYGPFAKIHRIEREREKRKKVPKEKNFCIVDRSAKNRNSFYFEYGGGYYALVPIKYFFFFLRLFGANPERKPIFKGVHARDDLSRENAKCDVSLHA